MFSNNLDPGEIDERTKRKVILEIASKRPISLGPEATIRDACELMLNNGIRRVPVVGSENKISGILSSRDVVDFLGGGSKHALVDEKFGGNLYDAASLEISEIMTNDVVTIPEKSCVREAAQIMVSEGVGGAPIVDSDGKVIAIVSEGDFLKEVADTDHGVCVEDIMSPKIDTLGPETSLLDAMEAMIRRGRRRFPVMHDGEQVGMLRTTHVIKSVSCNDFYLFIDQKAKDILEEKRVNAVMNRHFVTIRSCDTIEDLIEIMRALRLGGLTVEKNERVVGIVTEKDIFNYIYS